MGKEGVISLLGCGWLGFPLAKSLISSGFSVTATTTTFSKLAVLKNECIDPYLVQFSEPLQIPDLSKFFNTEILIITIPPNRSDPNGFENYKRMVEFVCGHLPKSNVSKVILISSTSVYGETNEIVDELTETNPGSGSGQLMADTEAYFGKQKVNVISLRLAGLIGPGRMPGRFFAGKTKVPNGLAPVNLIHLDDVIGIIHCLIRFQNATGIFNGCAPTHPTRDEFYSLAAQVEGLVKPDFVAEKTAWKIVSSLRLTPDLNYQFKIPSLMDWLSSNSRN